MAQFQSTCFLLLCSAAFQQSQTIHVGRGRGGWAVLCQDHCGRPLCSESSPALKALPHSCFALDYSSPPNSPCTFMFGLFLLCHGACPPLLALLGTILNLQGLVPPGDTFLRRAPDVKPPSSASLWHFVHPQCSVVGSRVSPIRL